MINSAHDPSALHDHYQEAKCFPHIVIDDFLDPVVANSIADELEDINCDSWLFDPHADQVNKWSMPDLQQLPLNTAGALASFNSPEALMFLQSLTGIQPLLADPQYLGGGVHLSATGGRLGVHADFNLHPVTGLHRRLNALLYLNRDWDPSWNGQLEIWNRQMTAMEESVDPIFNRLVVFNVTDHSFLGVPKTLLCPPHRRRISLALYYYTAKRPDEEKAPFHWATWQQPRQQ